MRFGAGKREGFPEQRSEKSNRHVTSVAATAKKAKRPADGQPAAYAKREFSRYLFIRRGVKRDGLCRKRRSTGGGLSAAGHWAADGESGSLGSAAGC